MARKPSGVVVASPWRTADDLTVVRVDGESVTMSTGEVLIARYEKLRALAEQVCQEGCPIWIRTWTTPDGEELIELHRDAGATSIEQPTATRSGDCESF